MAHHDGMLVRFGSNIQRMRFEELFEREMSFQVYPETRTMAAIGVTESVKFMINQLGWDNLDLTRLPTYRNLTLEFLSSFKYDPDYGYSIHKGLVRFRIFVIPYRFSHQGLAELMSAPFSRDAVTQIQEDEFMNYELQSLWGSISGDPNCEPEDRVSTQIHNPAIRYFHMILAHTIFAKPEHDTSVSKEELFIILCASQGRPVNIATFMLANLDKLSKNMNHSISMGSFITFLAKKIGLQTHLDQIVSIGAPYASGFRYMDVTFCFNRHLIGNLEPGPYQLLVNHTPVHNLTLPNLDRTNLHDKKNFMT